MPRAVPVLVLSLVILGCSTHPPPTDVLPTDVVAPSDTVEEGAKEREPVEWPPLPDSVLESAREERRGDDEAPRPGGSIRALETVGSAAPALLGSLGAPQRIFAGPENWKTDDSCRVVPVLGGLRASDVVAAWNAALADGAGSLDWLLSQASAREVVKRGERRIERADPRAVEDGVRMCGTGSVTDLVARLAHPALRRALVGRPSVDAGAPFLAEQGGRFVANAGLGEEAPHVDRVTAIQPGGAPALLFKLGDVDVALVQGHDVRALEALPERVGLTRVPAREPTYFLWLDPRTRWLNAETVRFWLASAIDRAQIVQLLFDGRGARAYTLRADPAAQPGFDITPDSPLPATSQPRLTLHFDQADPSAGLLAARLRAELGAKHVDLEVGGLPRPELLGRLVRGQIEIALLRHRPETQDPVLALLGTVWWLGKAAEAETLGLVEASRLEDPRERAAAAARIENRLLEDARIVPLVRLESWLATREGLSGVKVDPDGTLRLDGAWWRR